MFGTLKTLMTGANARAEETLRDTYAIELIDQKIREATASLSAAKTTLASLIQQQRAEIRQIEALQTRISDLMQRAQAALKDDRSDLAGQAAQAVADLENELTLRQTTSQRLEARILQLRQSLETAHRRLLDLKQGAIAARAIRREQKVQRRIAPHLAAQSPFDEAEDLINRVTQDADPFEQSQILREIDTGLSADRTAGDIAGQMADAGYGPATQSTAASVLARLKAET